jgi:ribonuclease-3
MEFLGDAVLGYLISSELYQRFPTATEGILSRLRASLVKGDTLADMATQLQFGDFLILGSGELKSGGFRRRSILSDAFEAVIGAIYLDSDIDTVRQCILPFFKPSLDECDPDAVKKDAKTHLQEYLQSRGHALPEYTVINISGEAHKQTFEVECRLTELDIISTGQGSSRRKAEQQAAQKALELLEV